MESSPKALFNGGYIFLVELSFFYSDSELLAVSDSDSTTMSTLSTVGNQKLRHQKLRLFEGFDKILFDQKLRLFMGSQNSRWPKVRFFSNYDTK